MASSLLQRVAENDQSYNTFYNTSNPLRSSLLKSIIKVYPSVYKANSTPLSCILYWYTCTHTSISVDCESDLVVGAPYEGSGAVYVFRGSRHQSASAVFHLSQRIYATDLKRVTGLRTFGYSIADTRGVDIDGNEYPDVVVGSYAADAVIVLRTRPVIRVETALSSVPERLNPASTTCYDGTVNNCFNITACFRFTAEPKNR